MVLTKELAIGIFRKKKTVQQTLVLDLPMNQSQTMPPLDESGFLRTVQVQDTPVIQSTFKRTGVSFSCSFPGDADSNSNGAFRFPLAIWNRFAASFTIEAWVYLPSANLTGTASGAANPRNGICGVGGASAGGTILYVKNTNLANPFLELSNNVGNVVTCSSNFPLNQWVKIKVLHEIFSPTQRKTKIFIDDVLQATNNTFTFNGTNGPGSPDFFIGKYDDNIVGIYNAAWRGYISDFKLYSSVF